MKNESDETADNLKLFLLADNPFDQSFIGFTDERMNQFIDSLFKFERIMHFSRFILTI